MIYYEGENLRRDNTSGNPGLIANVLFQKDKVSPAELARCYAISAVAPRPVVLTVEKDTMKFLDDGLSPPTYPLHLELKVYTTLALA